MDFMKNYEESGGSDLALLADYARLSSEYLEFCEEFERWEDEALNAAESAYYIEVQARVNKRLLELY